MSDLKVAHNRKIKTIADLEKQWDDYKFDCDNQVVTVHEFSQRLGDFVSRDLPKRISYTIEGFCVFLGISRVAFYENYSDVEPWASVVARMRAECERDVRKKFETGELPSQLSGLWMSRHGYGTIKAETDASNLVDDWVKGVMESDGAEIQTP